jgi:hypothetical protein
MGQRALRSKERCRRRGYDLRVRWLREARTVNPLERPVPANLLCEIHKVAILGTLVEFQAVMVQIG